MQVNGLEKIRIFQDFYFEQNGVEISYREAVRLFYQMDNATKSEFEEYYKDETGYEIISANGFNLDLNINVKTHIDNGVEKVTRVNGKVVRTKTTTNSDGTTTTIENYVAQTTKNAIHTKYTLEGFMKEQGMVLDPQWAGFSAEEIMQMVDNGVNVPQEVVDIANTILQSSGVNLTDDETDDDTTEKEPFLELVPKAVKHIEDCNETQEKINDEIEALLPEKQKREKALKDKLKEQKNSLKDYEDLVTEWQSLKDKIENGEVLSERENNRYSELSEMLGAKKEASEDAGLDTKEIASSLSEINILALLGEQLADKTIEIGETLEDYTSKTNYTQTSKEVSAAVGPFYTYIAMAHGKYIGEEAVKIGNETKEYTEETAASVNGIAETLDITGNIATVDEEGNIVNPEDSENNDKKPRKKDKKDEFFFVTDKEVLQYIKEAKEINSDLYKQIKIALTQIKVAKKDVKFAAIADKVITKVVNEFLAAEEQRQQEIQKEEEKKKEAATKTQDAQNKINEAQAEIQELEENKKANEEFSVSGANNNNSEIDAKIQEQQGIIDEQNEIVKVQSKIVEVSDKKIEQVQIESEQQKEEVKQKTIKEKQGIDKATEIEKEALKINTAYQEKDLPKHNERMDFINRAGVNLMLIGSNEITIGGYYQIIGAALMSNIFTFKEGLFYSILGTTLVTKGTISVGIGATACKVSDDESLVEDAETTTDSSEKNINGALNRLGGVNEKLASVIDEYSTEEDGGVQNSDGTQDSEGTQGAEGSQEDTEDGGEGDDATADPTTPTTSSVQTAPVVTTSAAQTTPVATAVDETPSPEDPTEDPTKPEDPTTKPAEETTPGTTPEPPAEEGGEGSNADDTTQSPTIAPTTAKSKTKEDRNKQAENADTGKANDIVKDAANSGKADSKESEKIEKDDKKDRKTLEKEAKRLEKQMKKDEKEIIRMTKESIEAAKKEEEILVKYEAIKAENEALAAEDEAAQQSGTQPTQGNEQQGGVGATNSFAMGGTQSDNSSKLQENDQKITTLSAEFKICDNTINRNTTKIKRLEKTTKTNQKKFTKKTKIITKKVKEEEKAEQDKQKRLAKQLAIVGIQENIFSLVNAVGTIYTLVTAPPLLANPFSAAAGAAFMSLGTSMICIGTAGIAACGLTKSIINLANGNLTAALMGLGTTAVSVGGSFIPAVGGGVNTVLTAVSTGLSVVSTSAELVNNVRAVQGKEAKGVMSKISTIAGAAAAGVNIAASFSNVTNFAKDGTKIGVSNAFKSASTFGKVMKVASAVGTAMSTTSQTMSEFGAGGKAAQLLGTIGSAIQLGASVAQMAEGLKNKKDANKSEKTDNNQNSEQKTDTNNNKTEIKDGKLIINGKEVELPEGCTIEGGKVLDKDKNEVKIGADGKIKTNTTNTNNNNKTPENKTTATVKDGKIIGPDGKEVKLPNGYKIAGDKVIGPNGQEVKLDANGKVLKADQQKQTKDAKAALRRQKDLAKGVKDPQQKKEILNGSSLEFAGKDDMQLASASLDAQLVHHTDPARYQEELSNRNQYRDQMSLLKENKQARMNNASKVFDMSGQLLNTGMTVMSMFASTQGGEDSTQKKKSIAPGTLTKRTKDIMKKNRKFRQRRVQALSKSQRYYA